MIGAVCYQVDENTKATIYMVGSSPDINWDNAMPCELGEKYHVYDVTNNHFRQAPVRIERGLGDEYVLRLVETKRYKLEIDTTNPNASVLSHFQNEGNKFLKCDRDKNSIFFQFINYLGRSKIFFGESKQEKILPFEVVPDKMNYEEDYITLTESLAQACSELLLEYSGSTSNVFTQRDDDPQTLLEQFIFLRQFCYSENLQGLFEAIRRYPDRTLFHEEEMKPFGSGVPSSRFYRNPFKYGKNWQKIKGSTNGCAKYLPQEIAVTKKHHSVDTVANRFVKYALEKFDSICVGIIQSLGDLKNSRQAECLEEAKTIHDILDDILRDNFFKEISPLNIMPQNNQVLQKREGYSQIFLAYSMVEMALQLDWKGKDAIYEGESKDVALLYEYWLFFELYKIIRDIDGCEVHECKEQPFIKMINDNITVFLEQGKRSCQSFVVSSLGIKVNLYYNRTFNYSEFRTTKYEESYSRPFRPDYTIAIYPDKYSGGKYSGEQDAVKDGVVSYIHFDAKYRIENLTDVFGHSADIVDKNEEIIEEKADSVVNTYKRGDLLKMHTYNDAIRRTAGSYVLYPGSEDSSGNSYKSYSLYDEILPGVGAFAIRPGIAAKGEKVLQAFIFNVARFQIKNYSRLGRMQYYTEMILREPTISSLDVRENSFSDDLNKREEMNNVVLGYIRADSKEDYFYSIRSQGLLKDGAKFLFYYYAIKDGYVYSHHKDIARASHFCFYKNKIDESGTYQPEAVLCTVESSELLSRENLVDRLRKQGFNTNETKHHADFYYVLTVKVIETNVDFKELPVTAVNSINGNDTFSPHSPKIINADQYAKMLQ